MISALQSLSEEDQHPVLSRWWDGGGDKTRTYCYCTYASHSHWYKTYCPASFTPVTCQAPGQCSPPLWGAITNVWCFSGLCCLYQISVVCNIWLRLLSQYCSSLAVSPAGRCDTNNGYQHHQTDQPSLALPRLRSDLSILWSPGSLACDYDYIVPTIIP